MRIIKINSCKQCPYRKVSHSFENGIWTLKCGKLYMSETTEEYTPGFKVLSAAKYEKKLLDYTIPDECPLEEIVDIPGRP